MAMKKKYYKVVKVTPDGKRVSLFIDTPGLVTEYKLGETTTAKIGGLLVFDNLVEAKNARFFNSNREIYEVEVRDPVALPEARADIYGDIDKARKVWMKRYRGKIARLLNLFSSWAEGTKAFKHVKLVKKVD